MSFWKKIFNKKTPTVAPEETKISSTTNNTRASIPSEISISFEDTFSSPPLPLPGKKKIETARLGNYVLEQCLSQLYQAMPKRKAQLWQVKPVKGKGSFIGIVGVDKSDQQWLQERLGDESTMIHSRQIVKVQGNLRRLGNKLGIINFDTILHNRYLLRRRLISDNVQEVYKTWDIKEKRWVYCTITLPSQNTPNSFVLKPRTFETSKGLLKKPNPKILNVLDENTFKPSGIFCNYRLKTNCLYYVISEYCSEINFTQFLQHYKHRMTSDYILTIAYELIKIIQYLHENRWMHGNIRPHHLWINTKENRGQLYLNGFSLRKLQQDRNSTAFELLRNSGKHGHPRYIAPEQKPYKKVGPRADQYAIGMILAEILGSLSQEELDNLELNWLVPIVKRCLAKVPEERFSTPHDVLQKIFEELQAHKWDEAEEIISTTDTFEEEDIISSPKTSKVATTEKTTEESSDLEGGVWEEEDFEDIDFEPLDSQDQQEDDDVWQGEDEDESQDSEEPGDSEESQDVPEEEEFEDDEVDFSQEQRPETFEEPEDSAQPQTNQEIETESEQTKANQETETESEEDSFTSDELENVAQSQENQETETEPGPEEEYFEDDELEDIEQYASQSSDEEWEDDEDFDADAPLEVVPPQTPKKNMDMEDSWEEEDFDDFEEITDVKKNDAPKVSEVPLTTAEFSPKVTEVPLTTAEINLSRKSQGQVSAQSKSSTTSETVEQTPQTKSSAPTAKTPNIAKSETPQAKTEAEPKPKPAPKIESKTKSAPKAEPKPKTEAEPKPVSKVESETKPAPKTEAEPKPTSKAESEIKSAPKAEAESKTKSTTKAESKPKTTEDSQVKTAIKAESPKEKPKTTAKTEEKTKTQQSPEDQQKPAAKEKTAQEPEKSSKKPQTESFKRVEVISELEQELSEKSTVIRSEVKKVINRKVAELDLDEITEIDDIHWEEDTEQQNEIEKLLWFGDEIYDEYDAIEAQESESGDDIEEINDESVAIISLLEKFIDQSVPEQTDDATKEDKKSLVEKSEEDEWEESFGEINIEKDKQ